ncbi:MAG: TonB-dependent receptor, partial [Pseudomonadota bacterium]
LSTLFTPTDALEMWLTFDYFDDKTPTRPVTALTQPGELFCAPPAFTVGCGRPKTDSNWHRRPTTTLEQEAFVKTKAVTLNSTWDASETQTVALVAGWRDVEDGAIQEFDGVAAPVFWTSRPQESDQVSIELRLESDWSESLRSTFGVYWFDGEYSLDQTTRSPAFFGTGPVLSARPQFNQQTTSYAGFGQVDWDVSEKLTLSFGGRYSNEEKEACGNSRLEFATGIVTVVSFGSCTGAPAYDRDYVDPVTGRTVIQDGKESWSKFTPRLGATYKFDDQKMVYATYSKGFRSGGYNGRSTEPQSLGPYNPEEVDSIEIGAKTQWLDNRLRLNVAAFTTDYKDKQEDVVFPDAAAVTVTLVQNAAEAKLNGAELELTAVPTAGLTLSANVGILDASYDSWIVRDLNGNNVDKSDFELRRAPKFTLGLNGTYEQTLSGGNALIYNLNYSYKDDYYIGASTVLPAAAQAPNLVEAFGIVDASITYQAERWAVSLWGKNLTDEDYFLHVLDVGTNYRATSATNATPVPIPGLWTFGTINPPRTYGVELRFNF